MFFELSVNCVYLFLLRRYTLIYLNMSKKCKCKTDVHELLPIPVKKEKDKIIIEGMCCNFECMLHFLDYTPDMRYQYTYNILWTILPFMVNQTELL